jgi:hypothetical protein
MQCTAEAAVAVLLLLPHLCLVAVQAPVRVVEGSPIQSVGRFWHQPLLLRVRGTTLHS